MLNEISNKNTDFEGTLANRCKESFFRFVQTFWSVVIQEKPNYNWHILYICSILQYHGQRLIDRKPKEADLLFNVPPGSTKSTIITIMFPAWIWSIDPGLRVISNSHSGDLSTEHAIKTKDIVNSGLYQMLFPDVEIRRDVSGKTKYWTTLGGTREMTSTTSGSTGKHAHLILNDDPQSAENADSEKDTKNSIEKTKALASRKVDNDITLTITITQRLNTKDVSAHLLETKKDDIFHVSLPAELTEKTRPIPENTLFNGKTILQWYQENDNLLDPVRLSRKVLAEKKTDLGSRQYAGQYQQNPTVEGGDIIKGVWFNIISKAEYLKRDVFGAVRHFFVDTAFTDDTENDPTGIITTVRLNNDLYILSAKKMWLEFPELVKQLPVFVSNNQYTSESTIRIEPKANGLSVIQQLRNETRLNVTNTPSPKDSKMTRLKSRSPKVEAGRVYLVEGHWNKEFIEEVEGFPNAPHDEYVDLLVYAIDYHLSESTTDEEYSNILW